MTSNATVFTSVGKLIRGVCVFGGLVALLMLAFGGYDCSTNAGWGWDCRYLWVAPLVIVIASLIFFVSLKLERFVTGTHR